MSNGKIYITISDTRNGSGGGVSPDTLSETSEQSQDKESALSKYARHRFFNFVEGQAKQFVNYSVNNIGNFTGNYQTQRDVQVIMDNASFLINLGTSVASGAKMGGVWGAVIAGSIAISSKLINVGYQEYSEQFQNRKVNRNIDMMRRRLGLEGLTDGSRTGGY